MCAASVPAEKVRRVLPGIRDRYRLSTLDLVVDRHESGYDYAHAEGTVQRARTPTVKLSGGKPPPAVNVGDTVEVKWGNLWAISEVTAVKGDMFDYFGHTNRGEVRGTIRRAAFGTGWREYKPGRTYKVGAAFEAIKNLSVWTNYADASQVLSYRAHGRFNVPPGKNWHHIHEQANTGEHSVRNLALVDFRINQVDFNNWYNRPQLGTGGQKLRLFLRGQPIEVHLDWGKKCIKAHGLTLVQRDQGRGPYQEIV